MSQNALLVDLAKNDSWTGNTRDDMVEFLTRHGCPKTAVHSLRVAAEAEHLAIRFGADRLQAQVAGWLHDISAVFPSPRRMEAAEQLGVEILPAEKQAPMILHQKLSATLARELFGVTDREILDAIRCHTTLRAHASLLDKIVFVADKVAWDQEGTPPYLDGLLGALERSLDRAVCHYLDYLWQQRHTLAVVHPWMVEAREQLCL